jgi:hypothetical protein
MGRSENVKGCQELSDLVMIDQESLSAMGIPGTRFSDLRIQTILSGYLRVFLKGQGTGFVAHVL